MKKVKIRLAYRLVITSDSDFLWDRYVFEDTFLEYAMQSQLYNSVENPKNTFRELLNENEKAEKLHFLTGIAAHNYTLQLKGHFHRITDVLGSSYFPFTEYRFDIINTDIRDRTKHKVGITFYSPELLLLDIINNCYLVAKDTGKSNGHDTLMFAVRPDLSICYYETIE